MSDARAATGSGLAIAEEPPTGATLAGYGTVPIAFEVREVLECTPRDGALGGLALVPRLVERPWRKDYDAQHDGGPSRWAHRFDVSRWGVLVARERGARVGGAVVAVDAPGGHVPEGRHDLAVLWDLRVAPAARGRGVGTALFAAAERWAAARGCRWLEIETQNVNVPACRFYASRGCTLGAIHRFAYPDLPDEVQLLWYKTL